MNRRYLFLAVAVLMCLVFLFTSCEKKQVNNKIITKNGLLFMEGSHVPYTGNVRSKVADKIIEYGVVNGKRQGSFKIFYKDGKPQIIGQMYNNKNEGLFRYFYDSPQLESEGIFKSDLPDSTWTWYFIDGKLRQRGSFSLGLREGKWISYNETGAITSEKYFVNGKEIPKVNYKDKNS